uniref:Uncharacterized protein n=1 Tax=Arundo donax TaxID=35708 RepID=A0A0A9CLU6_ARUDO
MTASTNLHTWHLGNTHGLQEKWILDGCVIMMRFKIHFLLVNCPLHPLQFLYNLMVLPCNYIEMRIYTLILA